MAGSNTASSRFGRYLVDRIEERDIDLMLLEEISCTVEFQALLVGRLLDPDRRWRFLEAANSISTVSHGESDLIAVFGSEDGRVAAVMVENKITANFMPEQADRYRRRGDRGCEEGLWSEYVTVLLAPRRYLSADHNGHVFDRHLAYEDLIEWFERPGSGARGSWRANLLRRASAGSKSTVYNRVADAATSGFFHAYWATSSTEYPDLRMKRDKDRPAKSTWVRFYPDIGLPSHVTLHHKAAETFAADLSFARTSVEDLYAAAGAIVGPDMSIEQTHRSAVIRIRTEPLSVAKDYAEQLPHVRSGLDAARRLADFFKAHREALSTVAHR